jgi:nucleotide-binding universal stress UspA family protein
MHSQPGTIVVGIDGSESSDRALKWAIQQAALEHRPLTLVHAIHAVTPVYMDAVIVDAHEARSVLEAAGKEVLDAARATVERVAPDLEVHQVFDVADPRQVLLQLSADAATLVVGSRGRGQLRTLLLGSVSVALVRHAHCPVVVIRPGKVGTVRNGILVGVDASPESRPVLEFAYREAALRDLPLLVLDCVWDMQVGTIGAFPVANPGAHLDEERLAVAEAMAGMCEKYPEVHVTTKLAKGTPQETLVRLGDRMDLIVVGAHQNSRIAQTLFGSVSVAVVENAACPVAVVPVSTSVAQVE